MIKNILRIEAFVVLGVVIAAYYTFDFNWVLFLVLLLVPDISMVGYVANTSWGAVTYNIGHTYSIPLLLLAGGWAMNSEIVASVSLIWIAHIAMDRALGFGLKKKTSFKETHLGTIA